MVSFRKRILLFTAVEALITILGSKFTCITELKLFKLFFRFLYFACFAID